MKKSKTDIWLPIYIGDYLSDTMHLTTEQHGAYLLILMAYWKNGGPLDESKLRSICHMENGSWECTKDVLSEFFDTATKPGKWISPRSEKEIKIALKNKKTNVNKAKRAANKRWGNE